MAWYNRWQAITWSSGDPFHRRIYVSPGADVLKIIQWDFADEKFA